MFIPSVLLNMHNVAVLTSSFEGAFIVELDALDWVHRTAFCDVLGLDWVERQRFDRTFDDSESVAPLVHPSSSGGDFSCTLAL